MKTFIAATLLTAAAFSFGTSPADARGCIKGALVGGAAGHLAHHGIMGAIAGCAAGHHMANRSVTRTTTMHRY